jgi:T-lymphoma invasion and metastasis-inducing protein 2
MKKMAGMQTHMANDPASRQALERQMVTWDENLEKLHTEQFQLRCYLAAIQGSDLPTTKV